jgi:hypothetical protein
MHARFSTLVRELASHSGAPMALVVLAVLTACDERSGGADRSEDAAEGDASDQPGSDADADDASDVDQPDAATCGTDDEWLEPNDSFGSMTLLGATDFDTKSYFRLESCAGDVDHLLIGHLGGSLDVTVKGSVDLQVLPATVDEEATRDAYLHGERLVVVSDAGEALGAFDDVPAGFYLLRVAGKTRARAIYSLDIAHGCAGDGFDSPGVVDSSSFAGELTPGLVRLFDQPYKEAPDPESASLCAGDVDAFQLRARKTGAAVIELGDATNVRARVARLSAEGAETEVTDVAESESEGTRSLRIAGVDPASTYVVRLDQISRSESAEPYTFRVRFEYDVSANDVCSTAQRVTLTRDVTTVDADNVGTESQVASPCNGDAEVEDAALAGRDVFFWFRLEMPASVSFDLEHVGETSDGTAFVGSATVYAAPGAVCPSTFDQLLPLAYDGTQAESAEQAACTYGRLRISDVPAGDYLLVVDGAPGYLGTHGVVNHPPQGTFRLHAQALAAAFPAPEVCDRTADITLPERGSEIALRVRPSEEAAEAFVDYGACTRHQPIHGGERVIAFTATEDASVVISSTGTLGSTEAPFFDSVLAVAEGECRFLSPPEFVACADDAEQGLNSELSLRVRAGRQYFLIVDHWQVPEDPLPAPTIITFSVE